MTLISQVHVLTRTSIWHEPHSWPRVSSDRSSDAHLIQMVELSQPPGTGETASKQTQKINIIDPLTITNKTPENPLSNNTFKT